MRFAAAMVAVLVGAWSPAFAVQDTTDAKDQQIKDLTQRIDELAARLKQLETREPAPAANLEKQLDGAIRQDPTEALKEPRRLNISAPGLEGLDIGGMLHVRGGYWSNYFNNVAKRDSGTSFGTEALLGFNAKISENTRVYIEAHAAYAWGNSTTSGLGGIPGTAQNTTNSDDIRVTQAYLQWNDVMDVGGDLTAGRQKIEYGEERIIGDDEWNLNRTTFDAFRWDKNMGDMGKVSLTVMRVQDTDVFGSTLVPTGNGNEDNAELYGLYYNTKKDDVVGQIDGYIFHLEDRNNINGAVGPTPFSRLTTYGARWESANYSGFWGDAEGATQFGWLNGVKARGYGFDVYAVHLGAGFKFEGIEVLDGVKVGYDYATGGGDPNHLDGFVQLYPSLHGWFGITDLFSWSNIMHWMIGTDFKVGGGTLAASYHWDRMANSGGTIGGYTNANGALLTPAGAGSDLGEEFDLVYSKTCGKATNVDLGLGYFFPGDAYSAAAGGGTSNFLYGYLQFRTMF